MENLPPIALPLFFSNNNRESLFVTSRPSYLQMRASSQKSIMQPLILQLQQHTMAAQASFRARNIFFSLLCFLHFRGTMLVVCVQAFIPNLPLPQKPNSYISALAKLEPTHQSSPRCSPPLSFTHPHTFCLSKQTNRSVFSHHPLSSPNHLLGNIPPKRPRSSALTYLDIVGEIGP